MLCWHLGAASSIQRPQTCSAVRAPTTSDAAHDQCKCQGEYEEHQSAQRYRRHVREAAVHSGCCPVSESSEERHTKIKKSTVLESAPPGQPWGRQQRCVSAQCRAGNCRAVPRSHLIRVSTSLGCQCATARVRGSGGKCTSRSQATRESVRTVE